MKIAFLGLGNMGAPMARNLIKAGHELALFDPSPDAMGTFKGQARLAAHPQEAATGCDAVITMLPAGKQARAVYLGDKGLIATARPPLMMDCSTIDVETARAIHDEAEGAGLLFLDAPVSGGTAGAEAATLTFMVGGTDKALDKARPLLMAMGKTIAHAGGAGAGQAAKICNNLILGISMIGVCEAFVLAEKLGLAPEKLFAISSQSSGQCWALTSYCPVPGPVPTSPANRDYRPGFSAAMMLKDLKLAQDVARRAGAASPLGAEAAALYSEMVQGEYGALDFSGIVRMLRAMAD